MIETPPALEAELRPGEVAKIIASIVTFTFICYFAIGIPMAVLPVFVHGSLGFSTALAGATVSAQYLGTLLNRPRAGRMADAIGAKRTVMLGLAAVGLSGLSLPLANGLRETPAACLAALLAGRVILGFGEGWVGTGAIVWSIGRVGAVHTARVISWNGITTYGAIALGAPLGVWMYGAIGLTGMGAVMAGMAVVGLLAAVRRAPAPLIHGERLPVRHLVRIVAPFGAALAAGSVAFGAIAAFVTLYYASRGWANPAFALTAFGALFVLVRILATDSIKRFGGFQIGIACLALEAVGLGAVALAPTAAAALIGAGLTGAGFALLFPAFGVEAVALIPPANRGLALGVFNTFLDGTLGLTGPLAGLLVSAVGYSGIYAFACLAALIGVGIGAWLLMRSKSVGLPVLAAEETA